MSALNLAQSLIRIKSITPNDAGCFEVIDPELVSLGFKVEKIKEVTRKGVIQRKKMVRKERERIKKIGGR